MSDLQVLGPSGKLLYTFDFTDEIPAGQTLTGVAFTVPPPLAVYATSPDLANKKSTVGLQSSVHGGTYQVRADGTLSNGEIIPKTLTVRGFNG